MLCNSLQTKSVDGGSYGLSKVWIMREFNRIHVHTMCLDSAAAIFMMVRASTNPRVGICWYMTAAYEDDKYQISRYLNIRNRPDCAQPHWARGVGSGDGGRGSHVPNLVLGDFLSTALFGSTLCTLPKESSWLFVGGTTPANSCALNVHALARANLCLYLDINRKKKRCHHQGCTFYDLCFNLIKALIGHTIVSIFGVIYFMDIINVS